MNNDNKILELKKLIDEKEKSIKVVEKYVNKTNLKQTIVLGLPTNANIMNLDQLRVFRGILNMIIKTTEEAEGKDIEIYTDDRYTYREFLSDVNALIVSKTRIEEIKNIEKLRERLNSMLSEKAKVSMELDDIEKYLKG